MVYAVNDYVDNFSKLTILSFDKCRINCHFQLASKAAILLQRVDN